MRADMAAAFFDCRGQGPRRDALVCDERRDAELHAFIEPYRGEGYSPGAFEGFIR